MDMMRFGLWLLLACGCTDHTSLAEIQNASLGLHMWDCSDPNVPVGCDHPLLARFGIGGDGIGSRFSPPCVTLASDVHATIDGDAVGAGYLGGEFEGECEDVIFLHGWDARPLDVPTSHLVVADGSATFALDMTRLFGERHVEVVSPTSGLHPGDHVEAQIVLPTAAEAIEQGSMFVCDGQCPSYLQSTLTGRTITFDVPADATGPIKIGVEVVLAVERCDGPTRCTAGTSVSANLPVLR